MVQGSSFCLSHNKLQYEYEKDEKDQYVEFEENS